MPVTKSCLGKKVIVEGKGIGVLRYYGLVDFQAGEWCGIALEQPLGNGDGTVKGTKYFSCTPGHAVFVIPKRVILGTPSALEDYNLAHPLTKPSTPNSKPGPSQPSTPATNPPNNTALAVTQTGPHTGPRPASPTKPADPQSTPAPPGGEKSSPKTSPHDAPPSDSKSEKQQLNSTPASTISATPTSQNNKSKPKSSGSSSTPTSSNNTNANTNMNSNNSGNKPGASKASSTAKPQRGSDVAAGDQKKPAQPQGLPPQTALGEQEKDKNPTTNEFPPALVKSNTFVKGLNEADVVINEATSPTRKSTDDQNKVTPKTTASKKSRSSSVSEDKHASDPNPATSNNSTKPLPKGAEEPKITASSLPNSDKTTPSSLHSADAPKHVAGSNSTNQGNKISASSTPSTPATVSAPIPDKRKSVGNITVKDKERKASVSNDKLSSKSLTNVPKQPEPDSKASLVKNRTNSTKSVDAKSSSNEASTKPVTPASAPGDLLLSEDLRLAHDALKDSQASTKAPKGPSQKEDLNLGGSGTSSTLVDALLVHSDPSDVSTKDPSMPVIQEPGTLPGDSTAGGSPRPKSNSPSPLSGRRVPVTPPSPRRTSSTSVSPRVSPNVSRRVSLDTATLASSRSPSRSPSPSPQPQTPGSPSVAVKRTKSLPPVKPNAARLSPSVLNQKRDPTESVGLPSPPVPVKLRVLHPSSSAPQPKKNSVPPMPVLPGTRTHEPPANESKSDDQNILQPSNEGNAANPNSEELIPRNTSLISGQRPSNFSLFSTKVEGRISPIPIRSDSPYEEVFSAGNTASDEIFRTRAPSLFRDRMLMGDDDKRASISGPHLSNKSAPVIEPAIDKSDNKISEHSILSNPFKGGPDASDRQDTFLLEQESSVNQMEESFQYGSASSFEVFAPVRPKSTDARLPDDFPPEPQNAQLSRRGTYVMESKTSPRPSTEMPSPRPCLTCSTFESQLAVLEAEIQTAKNSLSDLRATNMALEAQLHHANEELESKSTSQGRVKELEVTKALLEDQLENSKSALSITIKQMRTQHAAAMDDLQNQLALAKKEKKQEMDSLSSELDLSKRKCSDLESQSSQEIEALRSQIQELLASKSSSVKEQEEMLKSSHREEIENLKEKHARAMATTVSSHEKALRELKDIHNNELMRLEAECSKRISDLNAVNEEQMKQILEESSADKASSLERLRKDLQSECSDLKDQLKTAQRSHSNLLADFNRVEREKALLKDQVAEIEAKWASQNKALQNTLDETHQSLVTLQLESADSKMEFLEYKRKSELALREASDQVSSQNARHKTKCTMLESSIQQLKVSVDHLEADLKSEKEQRAHAVGKASSLELASQQLQSKITTLEISLNEEQEQRKKLQLMLDSFHEAEKNSNVAWGEKESLFVQSINQLKLQLSDKISEISKLENSLSSSTKSKSILEEELRTIKSRLYDLESDSSTIQQTIKTQAREIDDLHHRNSEMMEELRGAQVQVGELQKSVSEKDQTLVELQRTLAMKTDLNAKMSSEQSKNLAHNAELSRLVSHFEQQVRGLTLNLSAQTSEISKLEAENRAKLGACSALQAKMDELASTNATLEASLNEAHAASQHRSETLQKELAAAQQRCQEVQSRFEKMEADNARLQSMVEKLRISMANEASSTADSKTKLLEAQYNDASLKAQTLEKKFLVQQAQHQQSLAQLSEESRLLKAENEEIKRKLAESESRSRNLAAQIGASKIVSSPALDAIPSTPISKIETDEEKERVIFELDSLKHVIALKNNETKDLRNKVVALERKIESSRAETGDLVRLQRQNEELIAALEQKRQSHDLLMGDCQRLKTLYEESEEEIRKLTAARDELRYKLIHKQESSKGVFSPSFNTSFEHLNSPDVESVRTPGSPGGDSSFRRSRSLRSRPLSEDLSNTFG